MLGKEGILVENYGRRETAALISHPIPTLHASEAAGDSWEYHHLLGSSSSLSVISSGCCLDSALAPSLVPPGWKTKQLFAAAGLWAGLPPLLAQRSP